MVPSLHAPSPPRISIESRAAWIDGSTSTEDSGLFAWTRRVCIDRHPLGLGPPGSSQKRNSAVGLLAYGFPWKCILDGMYEVCRVSIATPGGFRRKLVERMKSRGAAPGSTEVERE